MSRKGTPVEDHPAHGSTITIEPLRTLEEVERVRSVLTSPRDLALFTLGVNTNLRATDLLALRSDQVDWLGATFTLREGKTGKKRTTPISPRVMELLLPLAGHEYLFPSGKSGKPLTLSAWNGMIKTWCIRANLRGNYGARTIRKTWAYLQHKVFGVPIEEVSAGLNHNSLRETWRYLQLTAPEQAAIFSNFI